MYPVNRDLECSNISVVVARLITAPIGTITAWTNRGSDASSQYESLPDGWVLCDGGTIPEPSMWAGEKTPNLNGEKRFLRGGDASDLLKMESHQLQDHQHHVSDNGHQHAHSAWEEWGSHGGSGSGYTDIQKKKHGGHASDTDKAYSGVTVGAVSAGNYGSETRPINMSVLYIMRVF